STMRRATFGFSSKKLESLSYVTVCVHVLASCETSFSFVCEENFGSRILSETTAVSPSRQSSPEGEVSLRFFVSPEPSAYFWIARVSAVFSPSRWVPPSLFEMVFVKQKICSV